MVGRIRGRHSQAPSLHAKPNHFRSSYMAVTNSNLTLGVNIVVTRDQRAAVSARVPPGDPKGARGRGSRSVTGEPPAIRSA